MYLLEEFGDMIADRTRFGAYADAIQRAVHPGDVVVDLGCGPGVFALLACRAGARRVYAIDAGEVIHFAKQLAVANGFQDRIEFFHGDSRQLQLAERANVLVSDVRGALPLFAEALSSIAGARERFLIQGGAQIPMRDTIYAAVVECSEFYKRLTSPWKDAGREVDFTPALPLILNGVYKIRSQGAQLLTEPQRWCTLEYTKVLIHRAGAKLQFRTMRSGTAHGVTVWFETQLFEKIGFSTAPGNMGRSTVRDFFRGSNPLRWKMGRKSRSICTPIRLGAITSGDGIPRSPLIRASQNGSSGSPHFRARNFRRKRFAAARWISFPRCPKPGRPSAGFWKPWMEARHCRKSRMRPRNGSRKCFSGRIMHSGAFRC
jgi:predicted RNA methylase